MGNFKDLTNKKFGMLTVLERDFSKTRTYWKCKCDCGNIITVRADSLKNGATKSCGCLSTAANIKGQKFGQLTIIEQVNKGKKNSEWLCQCDCGNKIIMSYTNLKKSPNPNCGCNPNRPFEDLKGQRFNHLTVINRNVDMGYGGKVFWNCLCDCGNITIVESYNLKSGNTKSCGCLTSYLENKVAETLIEEQIKFQKQYKFSDLFYRSEKYPLKFDFAIFNNNQLICLVECQGRQHYDINSKYYSEEGLYRDKLKKEYCFNNNIPLIYIYNNEKSFQEGIEKIKQLY